MGVRGDADPCPRAVARPRDAPRGVPAGHEHTLWYGRGDARGPRLDPRGTKPRGLRNLRIDVAAAHRRRGRARRPPPARRLARAAPGARLRSLLRPAATGPRGATSC